MLWKICKQRKVALITVIIAIMILLTVVIVITHVLLMIKSMAYNSHAKVM